MYGLFCLNICSDEKQLTGRLNEDCIWALPISYHDSAHKAQCGARDYINDLIDHGILNWSYQNNILSASIHYLENEVQHDVRALFLVQRIQ